MGLNGKTTGIADGIRTAFAEMNGRDPSLEEVKDGLRFATIAEKTSIDPYTLAWIADATNREQRAKLPGEITAAMQEGIAEMRAAIPTGSELRERLDSVQAFSANMARAERTMQLILAGASATATFSVAALAILLAIVVAMYRWGYSEGFSSENNAHACAAIQHIYAAAKRERHGQTVADTRAAYFLRGCDQPT